jgi:hypothetical protein
MGTLTRRDRPIRPTGIGPLTETVYGNFFWDPNNQINSKSVLSDGSDSTFTSWNAYVEGYIFGGRFEKLKQAVGRDISSFSVSVRMASNETGSTGILSCGMYEPYTSVLISLSNYFLATFSTAANTPIAKTLTPVTRADGRNFTERSINGYVSNPFSSPWGAVFVTAAPGASSSSSLYKYYEASITVTYV